MDKLMYRIKMQHFKDALSANNETKKLTNFCRACLRKRDGMKFLLDGTEETNTILAKFASVLNVEVELESKYPSYLCKICEKKINMSFEFAKQCKASNELIFQYFVPLKPTSWINESPIKTNTDRLALDSHKTELETFNLPHKHICCHCNESYIDREYLDIHLLTHDQANYSPELVKVENRIPNIDVNENTSGGDEFDVLNVKEIPKRNAANQKMRLKQYSVEDVDKVVKMVRDKLYRHIVCMFCQFKATSSRTLSVHVTRVHSEFKIQWCPTCNELFDNLVLHNKNIHFEDLKCPFCGKIQSNMGHFMEHMASHSGTRSHKCPICNKSFISQRHLKSHQETHLNDKPFICKICNKRFLRPKTFRTHIQVAHRNDDDRSDNLNHSEDSKDDELRLLEPQNYCEKCSKKVRSLTQHNNRYHSINRALKDDKQNLCPHCGKRFRTRSKLTLHIRTHTGETPYKCQYCEKKFKMRNILVVHERTHTGEKPYSCSVCGKNFAQSSVLNTHLRIHTGRPEQCTICEKRFCRPAELRLHLRKHTGEKPYVCTICNRGFKQKSHLVEHTKRHSSNRPYKCHCCEKAFKNMGTLKYHLQIHTGDKPFKCSQCSYACRQPYSLTQHMQQHENDRPQASHPHTCEICQRSFSTLAHLTAHYNRFHSNLDKKPLSAQIPQFAPENIEFVNPLGGQMVENESIFEFAVIQ